MNSSIFLRVYKFIHLAILTEPDVWDWHFFSYKIKRLLPGQNDEKYSTSGPGPLK